MRMNTPVKAPKQFTHEGGVARRQTSSCELERAVCACLLWEDSFYESGESIADRIKALAAIEPTASLAALAIRARNELNLRHAPLLLLAELANRPGPTFRKTVYEVINRPDELGEFVAIYGRKMPSRVKRGLADCFYKFNEYQFAKYKGEGNKFSLRDVMFLVHPKPTCVFRGDKWVNQSETFTKIANKTLPSPDTWEVALSSGADKAETFTRLLTEKKLGYLALLRNLRNMETAGVDYDLVADAIRDGNKDKIFPFRFVAAWRAAPAYERPLDAALRDVVAKLPAFKGRTAILVDISGSMSDHLSQKSDMLRIDAASALAVCYPGDCEVYSFSNNLVQVKGASGLGGISQIIGSQAHGGTNLAGALAALPRVYDRIIVITDEQTYGRVLMPTCKHSYIINVASYQPSIVYGSTVSITGFSENVFRFMAEHENGSDSSTR